jgi:hypothetical protein
MSGPGYHIFTLSGGMCWQGTPPHTHNIQEVKFVIKMLWVKDNFSNKIEKNIL